MAEVGVDLAEAFPKPLTDEVVRAADVVVTMGCGDACPIYPGKRYEDWEVGDPAETEVPHSTDIEAHPATTSDRKASGSGRLLARAPIEIESRSAYVDRRFAKL